LSKEDVFIPKWLWWAVIAALLLTVLLVSGFMIRTAQAILHSPINPVQSGDLGQAASGDSPGVNPDLPPVVRVTSRPGEAAQPTPTLAAPATILADEERLTVLVLGIDRRPNQTSFLSRTDTMLILSVDKAEKTASMLSIPRDLYVDIPGYGEDRINTAFQKGMSTGDPADGAVLAIATIEDNLGIHIDHYLLVDFTTVVRVIDAVGGVIVQVPFTIYDPEYPDMDYGFDPFYIEAGRQTLDGATALKYMRTRHADNDFGRAARQQQVILAFRDQVLAMGAGQLITRIPFFLNEFSTGVFTDLSAQEVIEAAQASQEIPAENIHSAVLNYDHVRNFTSPGGASVLILREDRNIDDLVQHLFP
jgi:LCP family protein required for cell wall assembly